MMVNEAFPIIVQDAMKLNIALPPKAEAAFRAYYEFLELHGEKVNLTAISGAEEVARLHFLDSIALLKATNFKKKRVIDVGSGAGFPGVPLKIAEPSIELTLLEATGKKAVFLTELCDRLNIEAACLNERAEEAAHDSSKREVYDIAVSRAVARLNVLCELCLPFVGVGGIFIAMKSIGSDDEIEEAKRAIVALGAEIHKNCDYCIPGTDIVHRAVLIQKTTNTPDNYPRRFARIQKCPL
ncbi:MAG: 16S rRNA (guanine(527)-N(7))-methyltransferase RsmG [Oscillospiraceae bacterium]|nr:16S rRNA (guanine(527)-N(7))-methyltransferase RsmG [Oscillospiraceae bacterium]